MRKRLLVILGGVLGAGLVLGTAGGAYAYFWDRGRADVIAAGVRVAGLDVGDLHAAAARGLLERKVAAPLRRPLTLVAGGWSTTAARPQLVRVDLDGMVGTAVAASRAGPFDRRVLRELQGRRLDVNVPLRATVSDPALDRLVERVAAALDRKARSARVVPAVTRLRIVPSHDGVAVRTGALRARLRAALLDASVASLSVPTRAVRPGVPTRALARRYPSYLLVDRRHFQLRLYRHLKLAGTFRIAVGRAGLETPAGLYRIDDREVDPPWHVPRSPWAGSLAGKVIPPGPADPIKARWLGFYDGAGIHGTDELSSIGTAASHGCIRMTIPDVLALYPLVPWDPDLRGLAALEPLPRAVVVDVLHRSRPAEPVARLVTRVGGVDDRGDDLSGDPVRDDEGEHGLGQEAGLEDTPPVLVGDAPFPPVPDRLDDRHADVAGALLDRVDHRLDPLAHDDRLHLDHPAPPV